MKFKRLSFFSLLVLSLPLEAFFGETKKTPPPAQDVHQDCGETPSPYRASIRHIEGKGVGYNLGYTSLDLFLAPPPAIPHRFVPFLDTRLHVFDNGKIATNVGLGLRYISSSFVYGFNTYYDYRETHRQKYNQYSLGFEALGKVWDFRLSGYLPLGNQKSPFYNTKFAYFLGHQIILSQTQEMALKGLNAEAGIHIKKMKDMEFYGAFGPYYFTKAGKNAIGGRARIAGTFLNHIKAELSTSYDAIFHWVGQGELSLVFPFGPKKKIKYRADCTRSLRLKNLALEPPNRFEIIVVDNKKTNPVAINPATGLPFHVVFVNNLSHSLGTYESPYPTLALAQANSGPNDILYIFPGDGSTTGMNGGIFLQDNQRFWGSGIAQPLQTAQGNISVPAHSRTAPIITNTDIDTEGNVITLASNNIIRGFTIKDARNDAIHGNNAADQTGDVDLQSLEVSFCTFKNTTTFPIGAFFPKNASISLTDNQFLNNENGPLLVVNGISTLNCSDNTFTGTRSISEPPLHITSNAALFFATIKNNTFIDNVEGGMIFDLNTAETHLTITNNIINTNGFGSGAGTASGIYINNTVSGSCNLMLSNNTISGNAGKALYIANGSFTNLQATILGNTITNNTTGSLVFTSTCDRLTLFVSDNIISQNNSDLISLQVGNIGTATVTVTRNQLSGATGQGNGIGLVSGITTLNFVATDNQILGNESTGVFIRPVTIYPHATITIANNTITGNTNLGDNGAGGIDIENCLNLTGNITNNILADNASYDIGIDSVGYSDYFGPACIELSGNTSSSAGGYGLFQGTGDFNVAPSNYDSPSVNSGTFTSTGVTPVDSCPP